VPTVAAQGQHVGVAEPCVVKLTHGDRSRARGLDEPLPTVTAANRGELGVVEPFITAHYGYGEGREPRVHSVDEPLRTVPTENRFGLTEPFLVPLYSERAGQAPRVHSVDEPVPVIPATGGGKFGVVESFVLGQQSGSVPRQVVEPLIAKYNRTASAAKPVSEPLETVSTRDRFALVQPVINGYALDIRFRMLQPHELSAAMSFPKSYVFTGNKGDQIRQIGNAVDCRMAEALCGAILDARQPTNREREAVA
jgi:DNA (cytosine-5)-methyltransferase 1